MKKKILIFGPISDFGGREIEAGFIANILNTKYEVDVCTTSTFSSKSQVFQFNDKLIVFGINELIHNKFNSIRFLNLISSLKHKNSSKISDFSNNKVSKKYFNYVKKLNDVLENLIPKYDLIFICAQLTSSYIDKVVKIANSNGIQIIFRTTGTIHKTNFDYLNGINCFVHHSQSNASKLDNNNFEVIDQFANNENDLLTVPITKNKIQNFLVLSRLSSEKGIEQAIEYFLKSKFQNDILYVAGIGELENYFKDKFKFEESIVFLGFIDNDCLVSIFKKIDCLIIPSPEESGPLVGVEAMCAGKIIISTRVGAMPERLIQTKNNFWYNYNDYESFKSIFNTVKYLKETKIETISTDLRNHYLENYAKKIIETKYLKLVENIL